LGQRERGWSAANWSEKNEKGRWRAYAYEELVKRDKVNLDIFWLKDEALEESANLPAPELIAQEITDDLERARTVRHHCGGFEAVRDRTKKKSRTTGPAFFTRAHLRTWCANTRKQYHLPCFPPVTSSGDSRDFE